MIDVGETQHYNCDGCGKSKYDGHMVTIDAGSGPGIVLCHDCARSAIELLQEYVGEDIGSSATAGTPRRGGQRHEHE